jgi:predicted TIM-barrel fold metal-dependent hydrolase
MDTGEQVISADSHVAMRPEQVKARLASRFHEAYDTAVSEHERRTAVGQSRSNLGAHWTRPGHWEGPAHLTDMDADGLAAEVVYCEVSAFRYLYRMAEGALDATRAFNDTLADYAVADPKRLIVSYQIPLHDIDAAIAEVQRVAAFGGKSLQVPVFPVELGVPDYYDDRYRSLWAAVEEIGLPLCCHIGLNAAFDNLAGRDPTPQRALCVPLIAMSSAEAMGMWIFGGILEEFPGLRLVFVEPGIGWVSWWLDSIDDMVTRQHYEAPRIRELPSTYFRRQMHLTFMEEPRSLRLLRDRIGVDNIMWASDYPHPTTTWPDSRGSIDRQFAGIPADDRRQIVHDNAARVWQI